MKRTNLFGVMACLAGLGVLGACSTTSTASGNAGEVGAKAGTSCHQGGSCSEGAKSCGDMAGDKADAKAGGGMGMVSGNHAGGCCK